MATFNRVFFGNPRRINLKIFSHAHREDTETRATSQALNRDFYRRADLFGAEDALTSQNIANFKMFQKTHNLHPRL